MNTEINDKLTLFFEKTKLEDITLSEIKNYFKDITITNDYGSLVHAAVHYQYNSDKVLKFIKILFENGIDPNYKGNATGYTYLHLALYGYTDANGEDHSYSTDFIKKLIKLGKENNLFVNIKDNDGDTIIHTALASEIYTGNIIELITELGAEFNLKEKDNEGHNIYEALLQYKKEAISNSSWYNHLIKEEDLIKTRVEIGSYTKEEIENEIKKITKNLNDILTDLTYNKLIITKEKILAEKNNLETILKIKSLLTKESESELWTSNYQNKIEKVLNQELKRILKKPRNDQFKELMTIITYFKIPYLEELVINAQAEYNKLIETLKTDIKSCKNLAEIEKISLKLEQLSEESIINNLENLIQETKEEYLSKIAEIESLKQELETFTQNANQDNIDYKILSKENLTNLINDYQRKITEIKEEILTNYQNQLANILNSIIGDTRFEKETLWNLIKTEVSTTEKEHKIKTKGQIKNA